MHFNLFSYCYVGLARLLGVQRVQILEGSSHQHMPTTKMYLEVVLFLKHLQVRCSIIKGIKIDESG